MGWYPGKNIINLIQNIADNRNERNEAKDILKYDAKVQKAELKYSSHAIAYANGVDPQAAWAGTVSDLGIVTGNTLGQIFSPGAALGNYDITNPNAQGKAKSDNSMVIIALILAAFYFFTKK